jgi:hypothetical protein
MRRPTICDLFLAVTFYLFGHTLNLFLGPIIARWQLSYIPIRVLAGSPLVEWVSVIAASVSEELVFRGYLIERISALSGRTLVGLIYLLLAFRDLAFPALGFAGDPDRWSMGNCIRDTVCVAAQSSSLHALALPHRLRVGRRYNNRNTSQLGALFWLGNLFSRLITAFTDTTPCWPTDRYFAILSEQAGHRICSGLRLNSVTYYSVRGRAARLYLE